MPEEWLGATTDIRIVHLAEETKVESKVEVSRGPVAFEVTVPVAAKPVSKMSTTKVLGGAAAIFLALSLGLVLSSRPALEVRRTGATSRQHYALQLTQHEYL